MTKPSLTARTSPWLIVGLLWPVAVLNYLDRQMLATMGLSIKIDIVELRSAEIFGQLMAIFMWVYAFSSPFGGMLADRLNRKWLIVLSLGVWSAVTLAMGRSHGYSELHTLRALMGLSEALYIPAGLALIADYHPGPTRSIAIGVHMSGIYLGQALGGLGGWVAESISWRTAFQSCGFIGIAYAGILIAFLKECPRSQPPKRGEIASGEVSKINWVPYIILILCFTLPSLPGWAVKNWLPTLFQDRFALKQTSSGLLATLVSAGASFVGVLVGGRLADHWSMTNNRGRSRASSIGLFLLVPSLIAIGLAPGLPLVILFTGLYGFGFGMFDANNMPILCQIVPERFRSTGYGILNFVAISSGAYLTPLLGRLKDHGVPLGTGFALCAIPALVAAVLMATLKFSKTNEANRLIS